MSIKKTDKVGNKFGKFVASLARFNPQLVEKYIQSLDIQTCTNADLLGAYEKLLLDKV
jgi:hypothetical protein